MPDAVIAFDFDPLVHIGDGVVRWETIGVAVAIFLALVVAGLIVRTMHLREDDLLFVVLGVVPGAVIGGRLGYLLLHPAFFQEDPSRIVDPAVGSLQLTLGVVGGAITGALVGALLDGRPGRWLHVGALPMLIAAGAGKLAMILGGTGQGQPTTGDPATAYLGPGPWGSLGPAIPSIPSQALEGFATLVVAAVMVVAIGSPLLRRPDGRAFLVALAAWAAVRVVVATTWRDPLAIGSVRTEQVIDLVVVAGSLVLLVVVVARGRGRGETSDDRPAVESPQPA